MNRIVGRLQAQLVLVLRLQRLQLGVRVLVLPLHHLLLEDLVLFAALQLLLWYRLLQLEPLQLGRTQLRLGRLALRLVALICLHGRVQLLQDPQNLLVRLKRNLPALAVDPRAVLYHRLQPPHQLRRIDLGQDAVVLRQALGLRY